MDSIPDFFKLNDIFERTTNDSISLPTVQRGFVWKPHQIENLWDSLLRGYPIGSFVLSQKINSKKEFELLDGQQRASAICLGFYNPINNNDDSATDSKFFKTSAENIMIFIDLVKPDSKKDNRKYIFRVITKSHPWGYRRRENQKTLESKNITKAMKSYKIENYDYLHKPLNEFWPYDSYEPIPLGLFINTENIDDLRKAIGEWKKDKSLNVIKKRSDEKTKLYSIEDIFADVKGMLNEHKIPLLLLNLSKLYDLDEDKIAISQNGDTEIYYPEQPKTDNDIDDNERNGNEQKNVEDRSVDDIENLFIRLNSGGTPLRGEELNYSILKAQITLEIQNRIEKECKGFVNPSRFITLAFRLFNSIPDKNSSDDKYSIGMKIKPKEFQRNIRVRKDDFVKFIIDYFLDCQKLQEINSFLTYHKQNNPNGLPKFVSSVLADKAPEVMFMLLYRLLIKKDKIAAELKNKVFGLITLFAWLGKGEKQKDHSKLLENIWPCVKHLNTERFWSIETIHRAMLKDDYEILTPFPTLKSLKKLDFYSKADIRNLTCKKIYSSGYGNFIKKMFFNKEIILFAQRAHLSEWFHEIEEHNLEDTNRPFDWDHIYPRSYIHSKKNIHPTLRDWYNSNGNFRAWPYTLNRKEQDEAPSDKLNPNSEEDMKWWATYLNNKKIKRYLLDASFCGEEWLGLSKDDLKKKIRENNTAKKVIICILQRNIKLCEEWYNRLEIGDFFPKEPNSKAIQKRFDNIIKKTMWKEEKEEDGQGNYLSIGENDLKLYLYYDTKGNTIKENEIYFGIYSEDEALGNIKIPSKIKDKYIQENSMYIGDYFTLISYSEHSIIDLFKKFNVWLKNFPDNEIKYNAIKKFNNSIKDKFKKKVMGAN